MAASMYVKAMDNVSSKCSRIIENGLESLGQLDKPIGQLALAVELMHHGANGGPAARVALHTTIQHKTPTCLIIFFNGNHEGASKYAQFITEHPEDTHTVVAVQLGLPGRLDSERKLQRLAQKSFVSVFTMVGGAVKTVVQQEPLSTPGGGVKLWLSDLVKEREILPGKFVRPLDVRYGFFFFFFSFFFVQRRHDPFKRSSNLFPILGPTTTSPTSPFRMPPLSPLPSRLTTSAATTTSTEPIPPRPAAQLRRAVASDRHPHFQELASCLIGVNNPCRLLQADSWQMGCFVAAAMPATSNNTCPLLRRSSPLRFIPVKTQSRKTAPLLRRKATSAPWVLLLFLVAESPFS